MLKKHRSFTISFILIAILDLVIEFLDIQEGRYLVKPLICIVLMGYLVNTTKLTGNFSKLIFGGLLFSLVGDIALIFAGNGGTFFMLGLGTFLIAHILYSLAFFRDYRYDPQASKKFGHFMLFTMAVFTSGMYFWMRPYLGEMKFPVMAYMIIISIMAILAGYRYGRVNLESFRLILGGAVFFIISDTLLAVNKFVEPFLYSGVLIMATYMVAQYLITMGAVVRMVPSKERTYR